MIGLDFAQGRPTSIIDSLYRYLGFVVVKWQRMVKLLIIDVGHLAGFYYLLTMIAEKHLSTFADFLAMIEKGNIPTEKESS